MKKQKNSSWISQYLFLIILLIISGCAGGGEDKPDSSDSDTGYEAVYTQADLAGTWRIHKLANDPKWIRGTFEVNTSGVVSCVSYQDSTGAANCPIPFDLQWTVSTDGTITESGDNAGSSVHMTMTSNFKLIAGTGTAADDSKEMLVAQRVVSGTYYAATDVQDNMFVHHSLIAGDEKKWVYGTGSTDGSGVVVISSETDPSGTITPGSVGTISVDGNGVVSLTGIANYRGFLSDDKKTIVGTFTNSGGDYQLMIIQIIGRTYGAIPAGYWKSHGLVVGNLVVNILFDDIEVTPFWLHFSATVNSSGTISFEDWSSSESLVLTSDLLPDSAEISLSSWGEVTSDTMGMHGQLSDDNTFMVSTQTPYTDCYSLTVYTDAP